MGIEFSGRHVAAQILCAATLSLSALPAAGQGIGARDNAGATIGLERSAASGFTQPTPSARIADLFEFTASAGFATDYIYRGTTLSDRGPAIGAGVELAFDKFYAGATVASVKLPSEPSAEVTVATGIRPSLGKVDFDFGWTYFHYPNELPGSNVDYWEAAARADTHLTDALRIAGGYAYSPNISNTGAWSQYAAGGAAYFLGRDLLPYGIIAAISGSVGYYWFGNQSEQLGGFPLPAYVNWSAGITFGHGPFRLDLRYYDTNLSPENCYVFTGDPGASPGGAVNPITNPDGLRSRWCSATAVARFWFELN